MVPARKKAAPDEVSALETALEAVEVGIERMRAAAALLGEQLQEPVERTAMPNARRAEQQLRTALNAADGARRSLQRRLQLRRTAAERGKPGPDKTA